MRSIKSSPPLHLGRWLNSAAVLCISLALAACGNGDAPKEAGSNQVKLLAAVSAVSAPDVAITGITKVSETRVSRTVFDYVFQVAVKNNGSEALSGVIATLAGVGTGATIVDGTVQVGDLAAGATAAPPDTITIRQDRTFAFDATALAWTFTQSQPQTAVGAPSLHQPTVYPTFLPLDQATSVNVAVTVDDPEFIPLSGRLIAIGTDGAPERVIASQTGDSAIPANQIRFKVDLQSKIETVLFLAVEAQFRNTSGYQRSFLVPVEFSKLAKPGAPSAVISDGKVEFISGIGETIDTIPLKVNAQEPFVDSSGAHMLRLTAEQAIASDDLSRIQVLSRIHVTPENANPLLEDDEATVEKAAIRVIDATGTKWQISLPDGADLAVPSRTFSNAGDKSLIIIHAADDQGYEFSVIDDSGKNVFSRAGLKISLLDAQLSGDGRFIGWQGSWINIAGTPQSLMQVIDIQTGAVWDFTFDPNVDSAWISEVPGKGFTAFINGIAAASCTFCVTTTGAIK